MYIDAVFLPLTKGKAKKTHQIATVKREVRRLPRLSQRDKQEWAYFINDIGRRAYNEKCRKCMNECKQSYRAEIICCLKYVSKRAVS